MKCIVHRRTNTRHPELTSIAVDQKDFSLDRSGCGCARQLRRLDDACELHCDSEIRRRLLGGMHCLRDLSIDAQKGTQSSFEKGQGQ